MTGEKFVELCFAEKEKNETYYSLLLALDGEASLGGTQMCYKIYDENQNLLNECGEIETAAFKYFMEK